MELNELQERLQSYLTKHDPDLVVRVHSEKNFEVAGTKEVMQGKQKVTGHYFASVMPKPKDVRLYFFPIYTHVDEFSISDGLKKYLKGKSCFHIKKTIKEELLTEIEEMIGQGVEFYKRDKLI